MFERGMVIVTGATGGVGQKLRPRLEASGFGFVGCARHGADVDIDLADTASVSAAVAQLEALVGDNRLAGLVNLAGIIVEGPLELIGPDDLRRQFEVNVLGPAQITRALAPLLRASKGRVVNIGAVTARTSVPFFGAVAASKAALASLSETMRMELSPFGVEVILIEPGALRTEIFAKSETHQRRSLAEQDRKIVGIYEPAIDAARKAMGSSPADDPDVVARAVMTALTARRPKPRVLVGKGASTLAILSKLPARTRDGLLLGQLGITKALREESKSVT